MTDKPRYRLWRDKRYCVVKAFETSVLADVDCDPIDLDQIVAHDQPAAEPNKFDVARCEKCGEPANGLLPTRADHPLCSTCYNKIPRSVACDQPADEPPKVRRFRFTRDDGRIELRGDKLFCECGPDSGKHWVEQSNGPYTHSYCDDRVAKGGWVEITEPPSEGWRDVKIGEPTSPPDKSSVYPVREVVATTPTAEQPSEGELRQQLADAKRESGLAATAYLKREQCFTRDLAKLRAAVANLQRYFDTPGPVDNDLEPLLGEVFAAAQPTPTLTMTDCTIVGSVPFASAQPSPAAASEGAASQEQVTGTQAELLQHLYMKRDTQRVSEIERLRNAVEYATEGETKIAKLLAQAVKGKLINGPWVLANSAVETIKQQAERIASLEGALRDVLGDSYASSIHRAEIRRAAERLLSKTTLQPPSEEGEES